jgi:hypothetical protein
MNFFGPSNSSGNEQSGSIPSVSSTGIKMKAKLETYMKSVNETNGQIKTLLDKLQPLLNGNTICKKIQEELTKAKSELASVNSKTGDCEANKTALASVTSALSDLNRYIASMPENASGLKTQVESVISKLDVVAASSGNTTSTRSAAVVQQQYAVPQPRVTTTGQQLVHVAPGQVVAPVAPVAQRVQAAPIQAINVTGGRRTRRRKAHSKSRRHKAHAKSRRHKAHSKSRRGGFRY